MIILYIGSSLRFLGEYTISFWAVRYFTLTYPTYQSQYVLFTIIIFPLYCIIASFTGGLLTDKLLTSHPNIKGLICFLSPLIAYPFILTSFQFTHTFYSTYFLYACSFLFSEAWMGPIVS